MKTYFIRHTQKLDIDEATRSALWDAGRIGIHFPDGKPNWPDRDSESLDPDDYPSSGRKALRILREISGSGGYVCAEYAKRKEVVVGMVSPGTPIELFRGLWGTVHGRAGQTAVLKTLVLARTRTIKPSEHAVILVGRPRQGTIMRWPRAGKIIENLVEGITGTMGLHDLSPDQQEIICSEYLRTPGAAAIGLPRLERLLQPVGRTMKDIDIAGIAADGTRIYAQVTYGRGDEAEKKREKLAAYARDGCRLILFCDCDQPTMRGLVHEVPIALVYQAICTGDLGAVWLRAAQGLA